MKSYATQVETSDFRRLILPSGPKLFHAPLPGEIYHLEVDMPDNNRVDKWYGKGTYVFDGIYWNRVSATLIERKANVIGANEIEVEVAGKTLEPPQSTHGFAICDVRIKPSNRKAAFSGSATLWVDHSVGGHVWVAIFRGTFLAALAVEHIDAGKPRSLSVSFYDLPFASDEQTYTLRVNTDVVGNVFINKCAKFTFDGAAQTAFIVAENT